MNDLIDRQMAIDEALLFLVEYCGAAFDEDMQNKLYQRLILLPSAQPEPQWIPVSERLPEVGKDVIVCYDFKGHRSVLIGVLYGDEKFHGYDDEYLTPEGRKYRKAVAWKPLPEPYRAERRTDETD